ncbi:pyridoxal phosphate-dependent aminotransferase [Desulfobulbus oligotrophicus]|jgi:aspartate aminotransferase|uniref:Aminotransferase n=1 Tax=Desulfobulbus oligotrophicus TaxID=1909699 RepID=A0A7T5VDA5_9BACT|nr:pyridoxal phosphate-dependent aminotransferase [Desulfobulbus oligotrophicus]MDY0390427.1 pyridoxal phosphate-dependent aminotransferase [Desulfobulbus oligotrophicus]QQG65787.1 pyridoxal phosphate-dependent aminotransferase [Desulfobulbus oligotrophicus]
MIFSKKFVLADRVLQIAPSLTLAVNAKAKALREAGVDVLNFSVGEPDLETPAHVCEAGKKAIDDGRTRYTPAAGILELRQAVCDKLQKEQGWEYEPEDVQISCGGKHGLYNIFQAILNPGDEVLVPAPYWVSYPPMIQLACGTPVTVPLKEEDHFDIAPEILLKCATEKTKAIVLNSPSNPTGAVYSYEALAEVGKLAYENGWLIISDDMYEDLYYGEGKVPHILHVDPRLKAQTVLCNGVSKSFAMTGWRIGYSIGPRDVIRMMNRIQSQSTSNPAAPSQYAALAALTGPQEFPHLLREAFIPRRSYIVEALDALPGVTCVAPMGAFYVFPNFSAYYGRSFRGTTIDGSVSLADYFLSEAQVASVPGAAFGADDFVRFSFATSMDIIEKGMVRIQQALAALQ